MRLNFLFTAWHTQSTLQFMPKTDLICYKGVNTPQFSNVKKEIVKSMNGKTTYILWFDEKIHAQNNCHYNFQPKSPAPEK